MNRWLPRSLWLLAWSGWAWLGTGLYRELPRDLGPVVCRLSLSERESAEEFLFGEPQIVTQEEQGDDRPVIIRVYDAHIGSLVRRIDGPIQQRGVVSHHFSPRHPQVVALERPSIPGRTAPRGPSALQLRSGEWINLPQGVAGLPDFHPNRPWGVFFVRPAAESITGKVQVVDLQSGELVFQWPRDGFPPPNRELRGDPFFIGEAKVGFTTRLLEKGNDEADDDPSKFSLEVWPLIPSNAAPKSILGVNVGDDPVSSVNGRVTWHEVGQDRFVDVYDVEAERLLFSHPPNRKREGGGASGAWPGPVISEDGRAVLGVMSKKLWHVDSTRVLWSEIDLEHIGPLEKREDLNCVDARDRFEVAESWQVRVFNGWSAVTFAVRSMQSGSLIYRCWEGSTPPHELVSSDRTLLFKRDEECVRSLPPRVNYPLLALCQTILALPLILVWAVLRWRRKRRMRLASVTP